MRNLAVAEGPIFEKIRKFCEVWFFKFRKNGMDTPEKKCPQCGFKTDVSGTECLPCRIFRITQEIERLAKKALIGEFCIDFIEGLADKRAIPEEDYRLYSSFKAKMDEQLL